MQSISLEKCEMIILLYKITIFMSDFRIFALVIQRHVLSYLDVFAFESFLPN